MPPRPPASDVPSDITGVTGLTPAPSMRRPSSRPTRSKSHRSTKSKRTKRQTAKSLPRTISVHSFDTSDAYSIDMPTSPVPTMPSRPTSMPYTIAQAHAIDIDSLTLAGGPSRPPSRNASRPQSSHSSVWQVNFQTWSRKSSVTTLASSWNAPEVPALPMSHAVSIALPKRTLPRPVQSHSSAGLLLPPPTLTQSVFSFGSSNACRSTKAPPPTVASDLHRFSCASSLLDPEMGGYHLPEETEDGYKEYKNALSMPVDGNTVNSEKPRRTHRSRSSASARHRGPSSWWHNYWHHARKNKRWLILDAALLFVIIGLIVAASVVAKGV